MSSSSGDMGNLLKQAQHMQRELDRVREELRKAEFEGTSGAGAVQVKVTGDRRVLAVTFSDEVVKAGDKTMLEDLVVAAVRDGMERAQKHADERMGGVTGGLSLPGLF